MTMPKRHLTSRTSPRTVRAADGTPHDCNGLSTKGHKPWLDMVRVAVYSRVSYLVIMVDKKLSDVAVDQLKQRLGSISKLLVIQQAYVSQPRYQQTKTGLFYGKNYKNK